MASIINASSSGSGGIVQTADASGVLQLQSNGTVALSLSGSFVNIGSGTPTALFSVTSASTETFVRVETTATGGRAWNIGSLATGSIFGTAGSFVFRDSTVGATALQVGKSTETLALQGANPVSGTGITFPAIQNASSDANTLDDYEEGTWTPTWGTSGFTASGATFSNARYLKIGRQVYVEYSLAITGTSGSFTAGDGFNIGGMPFTNNNVCSAGTFWGSVAWTAGVRVTGSLMAYNSNECYVGVEYASGVPRSTSLQCAVVYQIA
jgi:hypothetical protein